MGKKVAKRTTKAAKKKTGTAKKAKTVGGRARKAPARTAPGAPVYPVTMTRSERKLTDRRLDQEACQINVHTFPEDYARFMLWRNGGVPTPGSFVYKKRGKRVASWVASFCPVTSSDNDVLNLSGWNKKVWELGHCMGLPYDCFTIGYDGPGHPILYFHQGKRRGQVWLKDLDEVDVSMDLDRDTNPNEGMHRLGMTFDKFLASLCTEEEAMRLEG